MEVIDGTESSFSVPTSLSELEDEGKDIFSTSIFNCSEPSIVLPDSSCYCLECTGTTCILCCKGTSPFCCTCHECSTCWNKNWSLITATQITVFLLFVFGIIFVMMMYFRTCKRAMHSRYARHNALPNECTGPRTSDCFIVQETRARPPSYSQACSAPPLYESPYNRISMLEAPPVYPDTPKPTERVVHTASCTASIAHHI